MLTYDLEKRTGQPLYLLLYRAIREDILSGKLSGKLPSKRTLAQHLKLSTVTVENAYAQLIAEGFIESIEKKGYFVSEIPAIPTENRNFTKEKTMKTSDSSVFLDLQKNQPDPAVFPFSVWSKLMREVLSGEDREKLLGAA
ncbi:MAG: GntR family transcriptional regulator, partial [Christensenellaceae bacterium]|nr:GntR family transcriptional regulator [Christensenellaceae bacterium]